MTSPALVEGEGLRIAVEGCGHGTLDAIYASVKKACEVRGWDRVDLLIIGGDFQAVRNASDLTVMSCPVKYRAIGDFYRYYNGTNVAPYLTMFVGGNHEASSHLWELYYGGWVAPNIYYMGAANIVRVNGVRIAGMSGIWKGYNYNKHHHERLPYNEDDIKSIYHIRELDVRKLLQLQSQVDIAISHDWPRAIENHGDSRSLFRKKPDFEQESKDGILGNQAASYVMDRLRPPYWFSAHMHCKFAATKIYEDKILEAKSIDPSMPTLTPQLAPIVSSNAPVPRNDDEIDLDMDEDEVVPQQAANTNGAPIITNQDEIDLGSEDEEESASNLPHKPSTTNAVPTVTNEDEIDVDDEEQSTVSPPSKSTVSDDVRALLPAAFARPAMNPLRGIQPRHSPPPGVTNKTVRFLALDKCLPSRKFLQLLEVTPHNASTVETSPQTPRPKPKFEYDPEWLAITRVFAPELVLGDKLAPIKPNLGEDHYRQLIAKEQEWVTENIVKKDKLEIPENFVITAPVFHEGMPEIINEGPAEYNNPQMQTFCDLVDIENKFFATEEEKAERLRNGPGPAEGRRGGRGGGGRGGGRGRGRGRGQRGR